MRSVLLIFLIVFLAGCTNDDACRGGIEPVPVTIKVKRLEKDLFSASSEADVVRFLNKNDTFAQVFLHSREYPSNEVLAEKMYTLIQNPSIDTLYQEAVAAFSEFDKLKADVEGGLGRLKAYFPDTKIPEMTTTVTAFYNDLLITNEDIIIGMDFFIGANATYAPQEIPNYILSRYTTQHLPSIIIKFMSSQYVKPSKGETMLAEMIDHGKSLYLTSQLLPCTPERIIMGYTEKEWEDAVANDQIIWANFVTNEWFFDTNHVMKQKFIGERPNVYEIGEKCPGRIGQWVGWQIVNAYMKKTGTSMTDLLKETDANKIFNESGYKPG